MTRERIEERKRGAVAVGRGIMMIHGNTFAEILTALEEARKEAEKWRDAAVGDSETYPSEQLPWERPNPETPRGE